MTVKYPDINCQLSGNDGNAFSIMGRVVGDMRLAGVSKEEQRQYLEEAKSGDYDDLLNTTRKWVTVS